MTDLLARLAVECGFLREQQVEECLREARRTGVSVGRVLVRRGLITEEQLLGLKASALFRAQATAPPKSIGPYRILERLGEGGMSVVYRALDPRQHRQVAVKTLKLGPSFSEAATRRLMTEAQAMARLHHPGIVAIYEAGTDGHIPYICMELVLGPSVGDLIDCGTLDPPASVRLLAKVAHAVHFVHTHGIIHRDLKPSNILVGPDGEPRVGDFGVAQVAHEAGAPIGTPHYMSPEQVLGQPVDPRTDVYALGAVLFECIAGIPPFTGDTAAEIFEKILNEPLRLLPNTPRPLIPILRRTLQKKPEDRFPTALDLAHELEESLGRLSRPSPRV